MRWAFGILFALAGGWLVIAGVGGQFFTGPSIRWPSVDGIVTASSVESAKPSTGTDQTYVPRIDYEFLVEGAKLFGHRRVLVETPTTDRAEAVAITRGYRVGTRVRVYFDPEDATMSLLEPGEPGVSGVAIGLGACLVVVGILLPILLRPRAPLPLWDEPGMPEDSLSSGDEGYL